MQSIKTMSNTIMSCAIAVAVSGNVMAADAPLEADSEPFEDLYATPFDACFESTYNTSELTQNEAFDIAECFTSLLAEKEDMLGASKHTVMQYSASWYTIAAEKGHELAKVNLGANLMALHQLESLKGHGSEMMLASEQRFHSLDLDQNGMLSQMEVADIGELKAQFDSSDFDSDGQLSFGEYTIVAGEATAAGN